MIAVSANVLVDNLIVCARTALVRVAGLCHVLVLHCAKGEHGRTKAEEHSFRGKHALGFARQLRHKPVRCKYDLWPDGCNEEENERQSDSCGALKARKCEPARTGNGHAPLQPAPPSCLRAGMIDEHQEVL